ncbi:MAG: glycosyltransferase family 9 protein [SAR324 cluster bacterium]|uniref:Glycosyltransferase family 9 protein n=1 Tax=SAR324 cluster bacterium TaxID=2024889 RepID=A0A7X9IKV3_9DELT|nr:glycosyltransferase family 9 protein [SAR324 cluster bacterium]
MMRKRHPNKSNILLVNITRLGDMLQATPTIAGMKMENPNCKISVIVEKQFDEVCKYIPYIDELIPLDLGMTVRSLSREADGIIDAYEYIDEFVQELKSRNFDYCLNMSSSAYTALLLRLIDIKRSGGWTSDSEGYRIIESDWARLFATSVFHQNRRYNSLNLVDIFRCSADVEMHPNQLQIMINREALDYCEQLIASAGFTNSGPLISVQAGASQGKRQWAPEKFSRLINILIEKYNARVMLTGSKKEMAIIERIKMNCPSPNVHIAAGKTNIPQLAALLHLSKLLITGDTGPMHVSVAAGTPVIAFFLASAFGFETGPYSEGNLILQPVIECGPCNPNKPCSRPDCHDHIVPEAVAELVGLRLRGDVRTLPVGLFDPNKVLVHRSFFDDKGFCDLEQLNEPLSDPYDTYRLAYRRMWMDDIGDLVPELVQKYPPHESNLGALPGAAEIRECSKKGQILIQRLIDLIKDPQSPAQQLGEVNEKIGNLDRKIEHLGYHYSHLGPLSRMFIFAKENISGTEALDLASQTRGLYLDLERRSIKLATYYANL